MKRLDSDPVIPSFFLGAVLAVELCSHSKPEEIATPSQEINKSVEDILSAENNQMWNLGEVLSKDLKKQIGLDFALEMDPRDIGKAMLSLRFNDELYLIKEELINEKEGVFKINFEKITMNPDRPQEIMSVKIEAQSAEELSQKIAQQFDLWATESIGY